MAFDHRQLLNLLDELTKPISAVKVPETKDGQDVILTINLIFSNACDRFAESNPSLNGAIVCNPDHPAHYRYLQIHLHILEILLEQEKAQLSSCTDVHIPLFSIQDDSILSRSSSFVVLLGLILHFDEGISLSLEKYLQNTPTWIHLVKLKSSLSHHDRMYFLNETLDRLMHWIRTNPMTSSIVQQFATHHLLELLLSHLQLLYSPNMKYATKEYSTDHLQQNFDYLKKHFSTGFIQQLILLNRLLGTTINSPAWLRQRCGDLFTSILIDPNGQGVLKIFQIILDSSSSPSYDRLYVSLAQILSACPKQLSPESYIRSIKSQVIDLLHQPRYTPIISIALNQLWKKYPKIIEDEIFADLFRILWSCVDPPPSNEIAQTNDWDVLLEDLEHLTQVAGNDALRSYLLDHHLPALINVHLALEKSLAADRERFFRLLTHLFSSMDHDRSFEYFQEILFRMKYMPLIFHPEQSSIVCLTIDRDEENDLEFFSQSISKLLFGIENHDRLVLRLFLHLLQSIITKSESTPVMIWTEKEKQETFQQLLLMEVLKRILEYLTDHVNIVIDQMDDTLRVIQIILDKITQTCKTKISSSTMRTTPLDEESEEDASDQDVLQIVLTIASLFITHYDQLSFDNKQKLTSLYPSLKWIEEHHPSSEFQQLAKELSLAFLTFGAVKDSGTTATATTESKKKVLIEEIDDQRDLRAETFSNAWACLHDASLPIRAHGLILFRRLIERADEETSKKIEDPKLKLLEQFQEHLQAEDSYEYLAAINVLSALTNRFTDKILPILCDEYIDQKNVRRKSEDQLKVGEILVKTTRLLGDLSSKYASRLINTFLYASKQTDDSLHRASALSNLGQLCTVLKYSLSKDLAEILLALKNYLSIFEPAEVRRAAILVCQLLCQSLDRSTWLTILGDQLTSFYQLIKHLYQSDRDDIVRLHAQLALEALNQICREFLQPSNKLEKQIRILS